MKRVLALAGACLLVAVALLARDRLEDDDSSTGGGGEDDDALVVACVPELQDACEALEGVNGVSVHVQPPADTVAAAPDPDRPDAWVTLDPWPEISEIETGSDAYRNRVAVASAELVLLVRTTDLPASCDDPVTWTCVVDGLHDRAALPARRSTLRPLVLGQAAADFFGPGVATNDFGDPDLSHRLHAVSTAANDPLADLRDGLPDPDAMGALAVQLESLGSRLDSFTTSPSGAPAVVAVVVAGRAAEEIADDDAFLDALERLGWMLDPDATTTGLPSAGVLVALMEEVP